MNNLLSSSTLQSGGMTVNMPVTCTVLLTQQQNGR